MAEILQGYVDTADSTPLSQAQTVAMGRHLQATIRTLEVDTSEIKRGLELVTATVQSLREKSAASHEELHSLKVSFADANTNTQKVQAEVGRIFEAVRQLQIDDKVFNDKILELEENKKTVDTQLGIISKDLARESASGKSLRQVIEQKINEDIRIVLKDTASTKIQVENLRQELVVAVEAEKEDRDSVKQAHTNIASVLNEVKKANTVTNIIENRLASTAKGVQANWAKCAELSDSLERLTESCENSNARVAGGEGAIKDVSEAGKRTQEQLDDGMRQLEFNSDRVAQAIEALEEFRESNNDLRREVNSMRQTCDSHARRITSVTKELKEVGETTQELCAVVKTESFTAFLPNILKDPSEAAFEKQGSHTSTASSRRQSGAKGTPRTRDWS